MQASSRFRAFPSSARAGILRKLGAAVAIIPLAFSLAAAEESFALRLWTSERGDALEFAEKIVSDFSARNGKTSIDIRSMGLPELRKALQSAYINGAFPDIVWTSSELACPFAVADFIQPVDSIVNVKDFVGVPSMEGRSLAVPLSAEAQLVLIYNRAFVKKPPVSTQDLPRIAKELEGSGIVPLAFDRSDPYWFVSFLGGFGGSVFGSDGRTPTLDTQAMRETLSYFDEIGREGIVPSSCTWTEAESLFKAGKAAMILDGDWSFPLFEGLDIGVTPIPVIRKTLKRPAPYISGACLMVSKEAKGDRLAAVKSFVRFASSQANQVEYAKLLKRLPGLKSAYDHEAISKDPLLKGLSEQAVFAVMKPSVLEMSVVWNSLKTGIGAAVFGTESPEKAGRRMQELALSGIKALCQ